MKLSVFLIYLVVFVPATFAVDPPRTQLDWKKPSLIAVQDRGRIKPFHTMATETVQFITGSRSWNGYSAVELVFAWLASFESGWAEEAFIRLDYGPLKEALHLDDSEKFFSPQELQENTELRKIAIGAAQKEQKKIAVSELEKQALRAQNKLGLVRALSAGTMLTILPNPEGMDKSWLALSALTTEATRLPYPSGTSEKVASLLNRAITAYKSQDSANWKETWGEFSTFLRGLGQGNYPSASILKLEYHYNQLRPFKWSWILYTLTFILLTAAIVTKNKALRFAGGSALAAGFLIQIYGLTLRCVIAGRPPVSNMYESIIWVSLGTMFFALVVWYRYRQLVILSAASVFSLVSLVLGDNLPVLFDPSLQPLEPVLRSNFWLTIHVLTITLSYSAFALSLCMGNVVLGNYLFSPSKMERSQFLTLYMYRAMQIGVVLLAAGTILGGIWADYSWGRFWGWDPKEVWALIALLLYLAVLHGRFSGWMRGFGFVAGTVISFLGVLMAWYGVNFVLGAGLHSYGFGSGGIGYVLGYIGLQLAFIGLAWLRLQKAKANNQASDTRIFPKTS